MVKTRIKKFRGLSIIVFIVCMLLGGYYLFFKYSTLFPTPKPNIKSGIYGKVISISDVQTFPDTPISDSFIFTYPLDDFVEYFINSEGEVDDRVGLNYTTPVKTNSSGNYGISLDQGHYALCFTVDVSEKHKHRIIDCVEIEVYENDVRKVNISRQFDTQFSCISENTCTKIDLPELEIRNWKTYTNQQFGFTIELPLDFELINETENSLEFGTLPPSKTPYLIITKSLSKYSGYQSKSITLDDIRFEQYNLSDNHLVIQSTERQLEIQWKPQFDNAELFNQILSTFRFTQ